MMNSEQIQQVVGVLVTVITVMGSLNAWFVYRLVRKIDKVDGLSSKLTAMQIDMKHIQEKISALSDIYSRIVALEKEMAIFTFIVKEKFPKL